MLTEEVLKANESLKDLTAEQIQTIATLSENDENTVIGQKFGEVYRQMDATIENVKSFIAGEPMNVVNP